MMVAVSIFAIVMMIGVGALLSLIETNKRAQAINSVMNNVNAAVENMTRSIRVGFTYHCEISPSPQSPAILATPQDCASGGGKLLAFESSDGDVTDEGDQVVYRLNGNYIERNLRSGANGYWVAITAPEVTITDFQFYVTGSSPLTGVPSDYIQPRVLMILRGVATLPKGNTEFTVQSTVTQRLLDI